jgi:hypothetical protein
LIVSVRSDLGRSIPKQSCFQQEELIMTILSNHKINTYLLKATRNEDLVARHATIVETKKFLADLEQDSRAELIHYGLAEMVSQSYKAAPTRDILEAKFGKVFLKMFKTKTRRVFRILG